MVGLPDGSSGGKSVVEFGGGDLWEQGILKEKPGERNGDGVGEW